ncbi:MAG: FkbM family methyltransferase, partial [Caldilineaceae bacterium]
MALKNRIAMRLRHLALLAEHPDLLRVRRAGASATRVAELNLPWLKAYAFKAILDIGANRGQFARVARVLFPQATIYSFEPLPDSFAELCAAFQGDANFHALNVAVGETRGVKEFHQNDFAPSSSLLAMSETHQAAFPRTAHSRTIEVPVEPLDAIAPTLALGDPFLVKIDTQGYESFVLQGGSGTIARAAVVIVETSFETLYEGQVLFNGIHAMMTALGFEFRGILD